MAVKKQLIEKKLESLKEILKKIEAMDFDQDRLLKNKDTQDLLVFRLQQAIETCIDIATHIIAGLDLPRKEAVKDAILTLEKEKIINKKLALKMTKAVDFRNIVVHHYDEAFNFKELFKDHKNNLNDLRQFAKEIFCFLEKKSH